MRCPLRSTHHTPSSGAAESRSFTKLNPANTTAATVNRNSRTATKRAWLSRFMYLGVAPGPFRGGEGEELCSSISVMSNFDATCSSPPDLLTASLQTVLGIIDVFRDVNYAFLKVSVGFRI